MRRAALVTGAVALLALGAVGGWFAARETEDPERIVETSTVTVTTTEEALDAALPEAVARTRQALLEAARERDYDALRPLVPPTGFEYTFGSPVPGGPIAYWQELERTSDARPLETLAEILRLPYVLSRGFYVWPWAYTIETADDLSAHERELLAPLGPVATLFPPGSGYLGWRAGIEPDGDWAFFVAGD